MEVWQKIWDEDLAKRFREHEWELDEEKALKIQEAGAREGLEEPRGEFIVPKTLTTLGWTLYLI